MNFYPFNIGDFAAATRHLTWDESMAYRVLLDAYYSREQPLPLDVGMVYRLAGAVAPKHRQAVDAVLAEFFVKDRDGFRNARCDEEIVKTQAKKEKAKSSAAKRWSGTQQSEGSADAMRTHMPTHSEGNAPNPNPSKDGGLGSAGEPLAKLEAWLRDAAGWQNEPAPMLAVTGEIQALLDNGADLHLDVLPVVKALAPKATSRTSWRFFLTAIARQRDQRIAAATIVSPPTAINGNHHETNRKRHRSAIFDAIHASIDRAEHGAIADGGGDLGSPVESAA